ncbi:MAG: DUF5930 domain-containing protein [Pseudomonadota bacterium]
MSRSSRLDGVNAALAHVFPERRVLISGAGEVRHARISPLGQAVTAAAAFCLAGWTIASTSFAALSVFDERSGGGGNVRAVYEERLADALAARDRAEAEAARARSHFQAALDEIGRQQAAQMTALDNQAALTAGLTTLRTQYGDVSRELEAAEAEAAHLSTRIDSLETSMSSTEGFERDLSETVAMLTDALAETTATRDALLAERDVLTAEVTSLEFEREITAQRQERILDRVEEAVIVSLEPMENMLRETGQDVDALLASIRGDYSGAGGPLLSLSALAPGAELLLEGERLGGLMTDLERLGMLQIAAQKIPLTHPVRSATRLTSGFGPRRDPINRRIRPHNGVDFASPHGTDIVSTADGEVTFAGRLSGYGRVIKIRHAWGLETLYAHLHRIRVSVGDEVVRGQHIGDMGNTGRSTGTHLHYEIRRDGIPTNPMTYLRAARNVL